VPPISACNSHKISSCCRIFLCKAMIATEGKQREYLNEWSLCCCLIVLKIGGSWPACLFVTWDPSILHQAVSNLEAKSEPDQLTNTFAGRRVRKRRKTWPVNEWESNHVFLRSQGQGVKLRLWLDVWVYEQRSCSHHICIQYFWCLSLLFK